MRFTFIILAGAQVGLSGANLVLLYRFYGSSDSAAAFLLTTSVLAGVQLLFLMLTDQFVFHYHKLKSTNLMAAEGFYASCLFAGCVVGVLGFILLLRFPELILSVFAAGLEGSGVVLASSLLQILSVTVLTGILAHISQGYMSANGKISQSYVVALIPPFAVFSLLLSGFRNVPTIEAVAAAQSIGQGTAVAWAAWLTRPRPTLIRNRHAALIARLVRDSITVRAAHNIHNFLLLYVVNSTASTFPSSISALFFFAKRLAETSLAVVAGPLQKVLVNEISHGLFCDQAVKIRERLRMLDRRIPLFFVAFLTLGLLASLGAPRVYAMDSPQLLFAQASFGLLVVQSALIATELPYALVSLANSKSSTFYISNSIYITVLVVALYLLRDYAPYTALPLSMAVAQVVNFFLIRRAGAAILIRSS